MRYKTLKSRRGDYVIWDSYRINNFSATKIDQYIDKFEGIDRIIKLVNEEYALMKVDNVDNYRKLCKHQFWEKEDKWLLCQYLKLYSNFHKKIINSQIGSKNIISTNEKTCITTMQLVYNVNGSKELIVYQRSCDLSLGYLADLITLRLFMKEYAIDQLYWYIGIPHVYVNNLENTIKQFTELKKIKMNFNVR